MWESLTDSKIDDKLSIEYIQHKLHENLAGERLSKRLETSNLYFLNCLTLDESWSLLKKMEFRNENNGVDQKLESIGK